MASFSCASPGIDSPQLEVYPCMNQYVGKFVLPKGKLPSIAPDVASIAIQTVVILDRSGSMGCEVGRITTNLLPAMLRKLQYKDEDVVVFITFENVGVCEVLNLAQLASHDIDCRGGTMMSSGLNQLVQYYPKLQPNMPLRIMIFSDGEVSDKDQVLSTSDKLAEMFKEGGFTINAQGFRWFTSSSQPDTKALASVLKLNTVGTVMLQDVNAELEDSTLIDILAGVFENDGFDDSRVLQTGSDVKILLDYPWQTAGTSELFVRPGENVFWLSEAPTDGDIFLSCQDSQTKGDKFERIKVPVVMCKKLNSENHMEVLSKRVNYYLDHLKLLKVNETVHSRAEIDLILSYFTRLEKEMEADGNDQVIPGMASLRVASKLDLLQRNVIKRDQSFAHKMKEIANDDKVSRLSAQQTADYLRKDLAKDRNTKGLASRIGDDLDFTGAARSEVRAMHAHLSELDDVDDSTHATSVLDLDTTLAGVRTTCELVDRRTGPGDSLLDSVDCSDILRLFNIVGLACDAPIGSYPDAMTWRVNKVFLGTFCSVSDILTQSHTETGLLVPRGYEDENRKITNVIPFIEDIKLHRFLKKYAPKLLEFSAGEGMRRVLGVVSGTFLYTVCAGLLQLVGQLDKNRSTLYLNKFISMVETFSVQAGGYFDHLLPFLHNQEEAQNLNLSYFLNSHGLTNMVYPMLQIVTASPKYLKATNRDPSSAPNYASTLMPRILRAIYTHEIWQAVKRAFKGQEHADALVREELLTLLGVDLVNRKTPIQPLFEPEPTQPPHHAEYHINDEVLAKHIKAFWYLDKTVLLPPFLTAAANKDIEALKNVPEISDEFVAKSLEITYDLRLFRFYNIVQALIYTTKALRVDEGKGPSPTLDKREEEANDVSTDAGSAAAPAKEEEDTSNPRMRILDLKDRGAVEQFLREFVTQQYAQQYASDKVKKMKEEQKIVKDKLVQLILDSSSEAETVRLLKEGTSIASVPWIILHPTSSGFTDLRNGLLDLTRPCERRLDTLRLLLLGTDEAGGEVWNQGRALFSMDLGVYEAVFLALDRADLWETVRTAHRARNTYEYNRDVRNRHGHGRTRPSYWAMGFPTFEAMMQAVTGGEVSLPDFMAYCQEHSKCCGVDRITKGRYAQNENTESKE